MKITAVTRLKHGTMYLMLKKIKWTMSELARRAHLKPESFRDIMNLKRRPTAKEADAIQKAFAEAGQFVDVLEEWPETFHGFKKSQVIEQTQEVSDEQLSLYCPEVLQLTDEPSDYLDIKGSTQSHAVDFALSMLIPWEAEVLKEYFMNGTSAEDIAKLRNVCTATVHATKARALRKLSSGNLKAFIQAILERRTDERVNQKMSNVALVESLKQTLAQEMRLHIAATRYTPSGDKIQNH